MECEYERRSGGKTEGGAMQVNVVVIGGNLTRDPDLKVLPSGTSLCTFSVAINRKFKTPGSDELKSEVSYIPVTVWGKQADNCDQFLKKGSQCIVTGRLKQESWEKDGEKKTAIKVIATSVQFVGTPAASRGTRPLMPHEQVDITQL